LPDAANRGASAWPSSGAPEPSPQSRQRFPRAVRLLRSADFDAVYRNGRRRSSRHFALLVLPNGLRWSRFGSSVKRALGSAVVRNRVRRRIREILRLHLREIPSGWDVVIHPRSLVATAAFAPLAAELLELLRTTLKTADPAR